MKHYFAIIGAKYFDRPNGNTYNKCKIVDVINGNVYYTNYQYGYGSDYYYNAIYYIEKVLNITNYIIRDLGSFNTTKTKCKKKLF